MIVYMEKKSNLEPIKIDDQSFTTKRDIFVLYFLLFIILFGISYLARIDMDDKINKIDLKMDSLFYKIDSLSIGSLEENKNLRSKALKTGVKIPSSFTEKELETVYKECEKYSIPPKVIFKVIKAESNFNPKAVSKVGAKGYMQLMPKTYDAMLTELGLEDKNPVNNLKAGIYYISKLYKRFKDYGQDAWHLTIISYNYGPTKVLNDTDKFLSEEFRNHKYINKILN